jgi:ABC-type transport system substrate-binding protein
MFELFLNCPDGVTSLPPSSPNPFDRRFGRGWDVFRGEVNKTMKKILVITFVAMLFTVGIVIIGFSQQKIAPQSGGIVKIVAPAGPQVFSYVPLMGPADAGAMFPAVERLMDTTIDRSYTGLEPVLAEKVDDDVANKKIVFHLRKGVKFHDGTEMKADDVVWNFQQLIDVKRLQFLNYFKSIKALDDYTVVIEYSEYTNQLIHSWGWMAIYSKDAWDKGSGGNLEKGKEWARTNVVGTGPFMLKEFKRDVHLIWTKNPNYWRKGRPYLDGIEVRFIPDPVTASAMMQAKEADYWTGAPPKDQKDLESKGFIRVSSWPGLPTHIWPNTTDPNSKWNDKRLRLAIEYALDKPAIAKALGFGYYKPMTMLAPEGEWGYDPNYPARHYDPAKAKQLLTEAGYPNGLNAKLLIPNDPVSQNAGTALKQYLDAVGIQIDLDIADPGRFFGTVWGPKPGPDLSWMWSGRDTNYLVTYMRWFSTDPFANLIYLGHTPEQKALDEEAKKLTDIKAQQEITKKIVKYMTDEARIIPVYDVPAASIVAPYVHTTQLSQGFVRWQTEEVWMEKH